MTTANQTNTAAPGQTPALVKEHAAAAYLGISVTTLRRDRGRDVRAIPVIRIGTNVRYSLTALDAWIASCVNGVPTQAQALVAVDATPAKPRGRPRNK